MEDDANGTSPSTLVDPFAHYADRAKQLVLRQDARLVSNSEVQCFKRCKRKWWLAWYRGLRFRGASPVGPRAIGDRIHRALATWYVSEGERTDPRDSLASLIQSDIDAIIQITEEDKKAGLLVDLNKDADLERAMIEGYMQWLEETGADAGLTILASETYQDALLPGLTGRNGEQVYIIAKLDARVRRITDGVILFIDHKTVADFTSKILTLPMDEQMMWYDIIETLNAVPLGERSGGALYNMLRRVKRTIKAKPPFYQRLPVEHNRIQLENFYRRLHGMINEILMTENQLDIGGDPQYVAYPTPSPNCSWDCDFFSVCPRFDDGSRVDAMLETYFVKGDALAYYYKDEVKNDDSSSK